MIQGDTSGAVSHSLPLPWTLLLADARGNKTGSREGVGQGWGPGAAFEAAPCLSPHPGPQRPMQPLPGSQSSAAGPPEPTVAEIKAVVVGDGGCGKKWVHGDRTRLPRKALGCLIPRGVQGQVGCGPGQSGLVLDLVADNPVCGMRVGA